MCNGRRPLAPTAPLWLTPRVRGRAWQAEAAPQLARHGSSSTSRPTPRIRTAATCARLAHRVSRLSPMGWAVKMPGGAPLVGPTLPRLPAGRPPRRRAEPARHARSLGTRPRRGNVSGNMREPGSKSDRERLPAVLRPLGAGQAKAKPIAKSGNDMQFSVSVSVYPHEFTVSSLQTCRSLARRPASVWARAYFSRPAPSLFSPRCKLDSDPDPGPSFKVGPGAQPHHAPARRCPGGLHSPWTPSGAATPQRALPASSPPSLPHRFSTVPFCSLKISAGTLLFLTGCGGSVSLLVRPGFTLLPST